MGINWYVPAYNDNKRLETAPAKLPHFVGKVLIMKTFFSHRFEAPDNTEEDFNIPSLREDMEKTRQALEIAYAGFDNATETDMIDSYIYEINALLKRYKHLNELAEAEAAQYETGNKPAASPIRALVSLFE